jgi:hypothetical protein
MFPCLPWGLPVDRVIDNVRAISLCVLMNKLRFVPAKQQLRIEVYLPEPLVQYQRIQQEEWQLTSARMTQLWCKLVQRMVA